MQNTIAEDIVVFVNNNIPHLRGQVMKAFTMFSVFQIPNMEAKYHEAIVDEDKTIQQRADTFLILISRDLEYIINTHGIKLSTDNFIPLDVLNRICEFTDLLQRQESYDRISSILNSEEGAKFIIAELFEALSIGTQEEILDIVDEVNPQLIESIKELVVRSIEVEEIRTLPQDRKLTTLFLEYLGDFDSLGNRLFEQGYDKILSFEDLTEILPTSVYELLGTDEKTIQPALLAINILSVLMICNDTQKDPIGYFTANSEDFTQSFDHVTVISGLMTDMYTDFIRENYALLKEVKDGDDN